MARGRGRGPGQASGGAFPQRGQLPIAGQKRGAEAIADKDTVECMRHYQEFISFVLPKDNKSQDTPTGGKLFKNNRGIRGKRQ